MSLDVYLTRIQPTEVYWSNITHNLGRMADAAGIRDALWQPQKIGIKKASQLIELLENGLKLMKEDPPRFRALNASNGWGTYDNLIPWIEKLLAACKEYPDADMRVSV